LLGVESTVLDLTQSPPAILRPGGVSREQLEAKLGSVAVAKSVEDEIITQGMPSPGMTLKHYAPRARVEVFESLGVLEARAAQIRGQTVVRFIDPQAETLFARLREFDAAGAQVILCLLPPAKGIGVAVRDRLKRASGIKEKR
jgi:L-threonylcarbamoyladenylate synthase